MNTEVNIVYGIKLYDHKMGTIKSCYLVNQDLGYEHGYHYMDDDYTVPKREQCNKACRQY